MTQSPDRKIFGINPDRLLHNGSLFSDTTKSFVLAFRNTLQRINSAQGNSRLDSTLLWLVLNVSAAIVIINITQSCIDDKQTRRISALEAEVKALKAPAIGQINEQLIVEVADPKMKTAEWYQGTVTISPSDSLQPSKINSREFDKDRRPENLVNWNDISEINGTSVSGTQSFKVEKPLLSWINEKKDRGNEILNLIAPAYRTTRLIALKVVMRNELGLLERRYVYLPADSLEGYEVNSYGNPASIWLEEKNGRYYRDANTIGRTSQEVPTDQIGVVLQ